MESDNTYCTKGIWDNSIPGIRFDRNGISNYYYIQLSLMNDFPRGETGKKEWGKIIQNVKANRNSKYDCIIGVSGGTDSSYLLYIAKKYGLNPLAVNLDNGWNSDIAVKNIKNMTKKLDIDLETYVIDYEEIKDLLRAYMRAGLPWIDAPTDLAIQSVLYKIAVREKIKYIFIGNDFRSEGKQPTAWTYSDQKQLKHIHYKYGEVKLRTYPLVSVLKLLYISYIKGIKLIYPYYYLDYNKEEARDYLIKNFDWQYYGEHHHENLFTKWAISYWMFEKFNIDKRKITYSAQIISGNMERQKALNIINEKPYDDDKIKEETDYILKKLDISEDEYNRIWRKENRSFLDYPSYYKLVYKFSKIMAPFVKNFLKVKPKIFYEIEQLKIQ